MLWIDAVKIMMMMKMIIIISIIIIIIVVAIIVIIINCLQYKWRVMSPFQFLRVGQRTNV